MRRFVADTQCVLWYLARDRRLPKAVRAAFDASEDGRAQSVVPSIALVEAIFLVQRHRLPVHVLNQLLALPDMPDANIYVAPLDVAVARAVADFGPSAVPELADRIIAATARPLNLPLLTTDPAIEASGLVNVAQ